MNMNSLFYLLLFIWISLISGSSLPNDDHIGTNIADFYAIVIDVGSTGSRAFIFNIIEEIGSNEMIIKRSLHSMKGKKVIPGLSDFVMNLSDNEAIVSYFLPIFENASKVIPKERHSSTKVYIKGTAGMRLLPEAEQDLMWSIVCEGLNSESTNPFHINIDNLGTISGHLEAYYAVVSSNYIAGSIDANLKAIGDVPMVGALDMGGSSTQLIFYTGKADELNINPDSFWSHSWLNFGVDKVREKVIIYQIEKGENISTEDELSSGLTTIANPCYFQGYQLQLENGMMIRGTGDSQKCVDILREIIWPGDSCRAQSNATAIDGTVDMMDSNDDVLLMKKPCYVDGIEHPPIQGQFYGMSVYFFAIDAVRHLGNTDLHSWPTPTIDELEDAIHDFCGLQWEDILDLVATETGRHKYTYSTQLPHRCLEALYITLLLEDGFGFHGTHRNITLAREVKGKEVEWPLGYALTEIHHDHAIDINSPEKADLLIGPPSSQSSLPSLSQLKIFKHIVVGLNKMMEKIESIFTWFTRLLTRKS